MGCVLGQHDETRRKEHAIYYLSKKFTSCEQRYFSLEWTCCGLASTTHLLRQYMLTHTTWLISKMDPIKYIFEKPTLTWRITRWQMLLSEYDLLYVTQKAIKGSALADYLAHQPIEDYNPCSLSSQMKILWLFLTQSWRTMKKTHGPYSLMEPLMH